MDLFAHYALGLLLSEIFNVPWATFFAVVFDIDHLLGYIYDKIKKEEKIKVPRIINIIYRKRTWFHSFWGVFLITALFMNSIQWQIILVSTLSHLLLDSFDKQGIRVLPPFKWRIFGPLPLSYYWDDPTAADSYRRRKPHIASLVLTAIFLISFFVLKYKS